METTQDKIARLKFVVDATGAQQDVAKLYKEMMQLERAQKMYNKVTGEGVQAQKEANEQMSKMSIAIGTLGGTLMTRAIDKAYEFAKGLGDIASEALKLNSVSAETTRKIEAITNGSDQLVDDLTALAIARSNEAQGLKLTAQEYKALGQASIAYGRITNQSTDEAAKHLVAIAAKGRGIKELGIEVNKGLPLYEREIQIYERLTQKYSEAGLGATSLAEKEIKAKDAIHDAMVKIARDLDSSIDGVNRLKTAFDKLGEAGAGAIGWLGKSLEKFLMRVPNIYRGWGGTQGKLDELAQKFGYKSHAEMLAASAVGQEETATQKDKEEYLKRQIGFMAGGKPKVGGGKGMSAFQKGNLESKEEFKKEMQEGFPSLISEEEKAHAALTVKLDEEYKIKLKLLNLSYETMTQEDEKARREAAILDKLEENSEKYYRDQKKIIAMEKERSPLYRQITKDMGAMGHELVANLGDAFTSLAGGMWGIAESSIAANKSMTSMIGQMLRQLALQYATLWTGLGLAALGAFNFWGAAKYFAGAAVVGGLALATTPSGGQDMGGGNYANSGGMGSAYINNMTPYQPSYGREDKETKVNVNVYLGSSKDPTAQLISQSNLTAIMARA